MPELPEVETTVRGLKRTVVGATITGLWTDWPKYFKLPKTETAFRRHILNTKILGVSRRGKNILIELSNGRTLLIHQKLSGHLLVGRWVKNTPRAARLKKELGEKWTTQPWLPEHPQSVLADPKNRFIRLIFFLHMPPNPPPPAARYQIQDTRYSSMLALSDLRRFAKVMCAPRAVIESLPDIKKLGPDPTARTFAFKTFRNALYKRRGPVKQLLLDQYVIRGIGNIYADEVLWRAKVHPLSRAETLLDTKLRALFRAITTILPRAIRLGGTSMDDYRHVTGRKGGYEKHLIAYGKENSPCPRCRTSIKRIKIGMRSSRFCPRCQPTPQSQPSL